MATFVEAPATFSRARASKYREMHKLGEIDVSAEELARARAGEPAARRLLFDRVAPAALRIVRRLVGQRALAEDLVQDTLISMYEHLDDFRGEAPFGVWVRRIAVSRCLMAFRSPWHRARVALDGWLEAGGALPVESDARTGDLIDLDRALARLSPVTRTVVWLYDVEGWTHEEIAQAFDRTVSFSKSQLARGHARLRGDLRATPPLACGALGSEFDGS
jgi:RNA polymerase sigma factor (sigma-70 family)